MAKGMTRRGFLAAGAALGSGVAILGSGNLHANAPSNAGPELPTRVPGAPRVKVLHFHFLRTEVTGVEYLNSSGKWDSVCIPVFYIGPNGEILSRSQSSQAIPLSSPVARTVLEREMTRVSAVTLHRVATMVLVTSDHPDAKDGVGIAVIPHNVALGPIYKYGCVIR
jgi:hypothetical protein